MRTPINFTYRGPARRRAATAASLLAGCTVMLAGCTDSESTAAPLSVTAMTSPTVPASGGDASAAPNPPPSTDKIPPVGATWLKTEEAYGLGAIVVDGTGHTVYFSTKDTPNESTCYDACADTWLPLLTSADPAGGIGIEVASADAITRRDGSSQATYKRHPLYYYAGDTAPGQTNGHGLELFGASWYALTPAGDTAH